MVSLDEEFVDFTDEDISDFVSLNLYLPTVIFFSCVIGLFLSH